MKSCRQCNKKFKPKKDYFVLCPECVSRGLARCETCGKAVAADKEGNFNCCGHKESRNYVEHATRHNKMARAKLSNAIFGPPPEVQFDDDGDVFYEGMPNE